MLEREREKLTIDRLRTELHSHYDLQKGDSRRSQGRQTAPPSRLNRGVGTANGTASLGRRIEGPTTRTPDEVRKEARTTAAGARCHQNLVV